MREPPTGGNYYGQFVFDAEREYPTSLFLFEYNGVPFSPLGGIQAISGQKKNGKTFFMTMLMACALEPDSERVRAKLPGLRLREDALEALGHMPVVLYVDTEMEPVNTKMLQRRVHWLCGWRTDVNHPRFHIIRLRTMPDGTDVAEERRKVVRYWVEQYSPDIIVIDGLRDLVHDFNDNAESAEIINRLMAMAERRNVSIWSALHYNPRPGNGDESKMRGHLGTELGNKVTDTFVSSKKRDAMGNASFTVRQVDARNKDVEDIHFSITDEPGGGAIPRITDNVEDDPLEARDLTVDEIKALLRTTDLQWPASRSQIKNTAFGDGISFSKRQKYLEMAINARIIVETGETRKGSSLYELNPIL